MISNLDMKSKDNVAIRPGSRALHYITRIGSEQPLLTKQHLKETAKSQGFPLTVTFNRKYVPEVFRGSLTFDDVRFAYPMDLRKSVINGMSFEITPGSKVGLCGEAGCGKSTVFQLLQRFYDVDPSGGTVSIDGVDIRSYNIHYLRQKICMVAQTSVMFRLPVGENIAV